MSIIPFYSGFIRVVQVPYKVHSVPTTSLDMWFVLLVGLIVEGHVVAFIFGIIQQVADVGLILSQLLSQLFGSPPKVLVGAVSQ